MSDTIAFSSLEALMTTSDPRPECVVCRDKRPRMIETTCGHSMCLPCRFRVSTCPTCREPLREARRFLVDASWDVPCGASVTVENAHRHFDGCLACTRALAKTSLAERDVYQKRCGNLDKTVEQQDLELATLEAILDDAEATIKYQSDVVFETGKSNAALRQIVKIERKQKKELVEFYEEDWSAVYLKNNKGTKSRPRK